MFNDRYGLTDAVLAGRKTMTRMAISPKVLEKYRIYERWYRSGNIFGELKDENEYLTSNLAPYKVGEVVAIAQSYKDIYFQIQAVIRDKNIDHIMHAAGWKNKMFVRANFMPHHIKITGIKVERLQDISDADCRREGIFQTRPTSPLFGWSADTYYGSPRDAFAALIDKVGRKGTRESNPLCFCYSFELID